jgi:gluconolactonase
MNRRQLLASLPLASLPLASLPLAGIAGTALAQPPAAAPQTAAPGATPAGRPAPRPPIPLVETPSLPMTVVAEGLNFPEGPVVMNDGSVLFVEIPKQAITRLTRDNKLEHVVTVPGGPNGLAIGPDGGLWIANNGGRFTFAQRGGFNLPGGPPPGFDGGGRIMRYDLKKKTLRTVYDTVGGKKLIAPDDLIFDRHGGLWFTELGVAPGSGGIYFAAKGAAEPVLVRGGMSGPNGIGLSPDGKLLHISMGSSIYAFDITGPGKLATTTYPNNGLQGPLHENSGADSLKVLANGYVAGCSLSRPGGVTILDPAGKEQQFLGFPDRMTCNLAFGGKDMKDTWVCLSGLGKMVKVRFPYAGQVPAFRA